MPLQAFQAWKTSRNSRQITSWMCGSANRKVRRVIKRDYRLRSAVSRPNISHYRVPPYSILCRRDFPERWAGSTGRRPEDKDCLMAGNRGAEIQMLSPASLPGRQRLDRASPRQHTYTSCPGGIVNPQRETFPAASHHAHQDITSIAISDAPNMLQTS